MNKGLDSEEDARLARRLKRRGIIGVSNKTIDNPRKTESLIDLDYASFLNENGSLGDDCEDNDPDFVMFLKHIREHEKSYIFEMVVNEKTTFIKYEEEEEDDEDVDFDSSAKHKVPIEKNQAKKLEEKVVTKRGRKKKTMKENDREESRVNGSSKQKIVHTVQCSPSQPDGSESDVIDCYEFFLRHLKLDGDTLVLEMEDGQKIRYEDCDENASDSGSDVVVEVSSKIGGIHNPFVSSKIYYSGCEGSSSKTSTKFKEKLMNILKKPFDKKEYKELYEEASVRKPLERHIDFRNGSTKRLPVLESLGKSYLDHYPDLKEVVDSSSHSRYIVLNILRGFFYYLENLAQEGAFRPWTDELCLKLIRSL